MDKNGVRFLLTGHLDVGFFVISEIIYIYTYTHTHTKFLLGGDPKLGCVGHNLDIQGEHKFFP